MSKSYNRKLIISGNVYELIEYEKPILYDTSTNPLGRSVIADNETSKVTRSKTLQKANSTVRRLINANLNEWGQAPKFLTLTFAENVTDLDTAHYEWKKFRQRLEYELDLKLKYVVVIEFQKRGAVHYHAIFFNLPYITSNKLAEIWENGFIKINRIDDVDNVGAYVTKYMTKQEQEEIREDRLLGRKSYFSSRGLKKPIEVVEKEKIDQLAGDLSEHKVYESSFENDYIGQIKYTQYNTKRVSNVEAE